MKAQIQAFQKKDLPSKFGNGTWTVANAKFEGMVNPQWGFKLIGFNKNIINNLQVGQTLVGYVGSEKWTAKDGTTQITQTFNAVDAEYVYDLLLKIAPQIESTPAQASNTPNSAAAVDEGFPGPDQDQSNGGW